MLDENEALRSEIEAKVIEHLGMNADMFTSMSEDDFDEEPE